MNCSALSLCKWTFFSFLLLLINFPIFSQWTPQVSGTDYDLYSVYFLNTTTGFLSSSRPIIPPGPYGGEIIKTTNGGNNWYRVLFDTTFRVKGIRFINNNTGFAVGGYYADECYIYKTTDGGENWNKINLPFFPFFFNIVFPNSSTGYAAGTFGVIKTTDAGTNWTGILNVQVLIPYWGKVFFNDVNTGFFIRDTAGFYKTVNGGINWQFISLPSAEFLRDLKFIDENTGYIVGDSSTLLKTTNQGNNWFTLNPGINQNLYSVSFADLNTGYLTAEHTVLKTTNAGNSWFSVFSFPAD